MCCARTKKNNVTSSRSAIRRADSARADSERHAASCHRERTPPHADARFRRRPIAGLSVIAIMLTIAVLAYMGETSPWSPHMSAWSENPVPVRFMQGRTALQMRGAAVFQNKQCRNCHALGGEGGERGSSLDSVAAPLTHDGMIRQVIQGGGNMPAYGEKLSAAEVDALVSFMATLHPPTEPIARDSAEPPIRER